MTHIRQRRSTAAEWVDANPVLRLGEIGRETDTLLAKSGDGVTAWNDLDYLPAGPVGPAGPPNVLEVGDVVTGAPGTDVIFDITGTSPSQVVDVTIPRGDKGETGEQGEQGPQGNPGVQGVPGNDGLTPSLRGLSVTSLAIGTGSKVFAISPAMNVAFPVGATVKAQGALAANYMVGVVTAATTASVTINVTEVGGSGTFASWTLAIGSYRGLDGTGTVNSVNGVAPTAGNVDVTRLVSIGSLTSAGVSGANYWARIATLTLPTAGLNAHVQVAFVGTATNPGYYLLIDWFAFNAPTMAGAPTSVVTVMSTRGTVTAANVKAVVTANDGTNPNVVELWIQTPAAYTIGHIYEVARSLSAGVSVAYPTSGPWQAALPAGTQTAAGDAVPVTGPATATLGNLAVFANSTGKVLTDSGYVPANFLNSSNQNAGTLPDARLPQRLGTSATIVTDYDLATTNGWVQALAAATNAPPALAGSGTQGMVYRSSNTYMSQIVWGLAPGSANTNTYRRDMIAGVWGAWYKLMSAQAEMDARYATLASPVFTGNPTAPTTLPADTSNSIATTLFVRNQDYATLSTLKGAVVALGSINGAVSLSASLTASTAINANVSCTLTGNTTFTAATMPTVAAGTQFTMTVTQDATGSRTLTLTNIRKPGGALVLSTAANAVDQIVFYYDGTNWYAALTGKAWAV